MTLTPLTVAMATVSSVLPESTTRISSAQAALSIAAAMCRDSLSVMIVTVTDTCGILLPQRNLLNGFEVDLRLDEVENRVQLVVLGDIQVPLRLEDQEVR